MLGFILAAIGMLVVIYLIAMLLWVAWPIVLMLVPFVAFMLWLDSIEERAAQRAFDETMRKAREGKE